MDAPSPPPPRWTPRRVVTALALGSGALFAAMAAWSVLRVPTEGGLLRYVKEDPAPSALMRQRTDEAEDEGRPLTIVHQPVALERIAPVVREMLLLAEDQRFYTHEGVDWEETRKVIEAGWATRTIPRGASTLTQQIARTLFLSQDRSPLRKLSEWLLAPRMERALGKKRVLELYLNHVEWGDGVFGIEAAARRYFQKSAASLGSAEAAILVAMLPSPRTRDPRRPTPNLRRRALHLAGVLATARGEPRKPLQRQVSELLRAR